MKRRDALKLLAIAPVLVKCAWGEQSNKHSDAVATLSRYFDGAEIQADTPAQREQLLSALHDMATLQTARLRGKRYADYRGRPGKWGLLELLQHHVVPTAPVRLTNETLFTALATEQGKLVARRAARAYSAIQAKASRKVQR